MRVFLFAGWLAGVAWPLAAPAQAAADLFAGPAVPQLVARQFAFTEGPAADKHGNVFFTDQPHDQIWEYDTHGRLRVFLAPAGRANGLYFDKQGNLLACADAQHQLWAIAPNGQATILVDKVNGRKLNGPNDLWVAPGGGLYFTDPYYERDYWPRPHPAATGQHLYYMASETAAPVPADTTLRKPNGLIGTPDGQLLYVADIGAGRTYRYHIGPGGALAGRELFVAQGSDSMTIDERGNVYLTGKGVSIYSPAGALLAHLDVPADWTGNVCFGGKDRRTLFITASDAVFTVAMKVRGAR